MNGVRFAAAALTVLGLFSLSRSPSPATALGVAACVLLALRPPRAGTTALLLLLVALGPGVAGVDALLPDPRDIDLRALLRAPSADHLLGTDGSGRDVAARLVQAAGRSAVVATLAAAVSVGTGAVLGLVAGWRGGRLDDAARFGADTLQALPPIVLLIAAAPALHRLPVPVDVGLVLLLGVTGWTGTFRLVRGAARGLVTGDRVLAARALGLPTATILRHHVLPDLLGLLAVHAALVAGHHLVAETTLSFLGLGTPPPTASLGGMIAEARSHLRAGPWAWLPPTGVIVMLSLAAQRIADELRDHLDPAGLSRR